MGMCISVRMTARHRGQVCGIVSVTSGRGFAKALS